MVKNRSGEHFSEDDIEEHGKKSAYPKSRQVYKSVFLYTIGYGVGVLRIYNIIENVPTIKPLPVYIGPMIVYHN